MRGGSPIHPDWECPDTACQARSFKNLPGGPRLGKFAGSSFPSMRKWAACLQVVRERVALGDGAMERRNMVYEKATNGSHEISAESFEEAYRHLSCIHIANAVTDDMRYYIKCIGHSIEFLYQETRSGN